MRKESSIQKIYISKGWRIFMGLGGLGFLAAAYFSRHEKLILPIAFLLFGILEFLVVFWPLYKIKNKRFIIVNARWSLAKITVPISSITGYKATNADQGGPILFYTDGALDKYTFALSSYSNLEPLFELIDWEKVRDFNQEAQQAAEQAELRDIVDDIDGETPEVQARLLKLLGIVAVGLDGGAVVLWFWQPGGFLTGLIVVQAWLLLAYLVYFAAWGRVRLGLDGEAIYPRLRLAFWMPAVILFVSLISIETDFAPNIFWKASIGALVFGCAILMPIRRFTSVKSSGRAMIFVGCFFVMLGWGYYGAFFYNIYSGLEKNSEEVAQAVYKYEEEVKVNVLPLQNPPVSRTMSLPDAIFEKTDVGDCLTLVKYVGQLNMAVYYLGKKIACPKAAE